MKILNEIAGFFNEKDSAIILLKDHFANGSIWTNGRKIINLDVFYKRHKSAFERRKANGVPHNIKILRNELEPSRPLFSPMRRRRF
jgi:hypothetical protein